MHESPHGCGLSASRGAGICLTGDRAQRAEPTRDLLNPIRVAQAAYTRFGLILLGSRRFHFVSNCHNSPRFVTATVTVGSDPSRRRDSLSRLQSILRVLQGILVLVDGFLKRCGRP
jgi:hypothetical protein